MGNRPIVANARTVLSSDGDKIMIVRAPAGTLSVGAAQVPWAIEPADLQKIRDSLKTGRELGGTFVPDPVRRCLVIGKLAKPGGGNHVKIPHGFFEWHTHPLGCGMRECSLAPPSSTDVEVMLKDAVTDNIAHLVFTSKGCFVVYLIPSLVARIRDRPDPEFVRSIVQKFEKLQTEFGVRYDATRTAAERDAVTRWHESQWKGLAKKEGFAVSFFSLPSHPAVVVNTRFETW